MPTDKVQLLLFGSWTAKGKSRLWVSLASIGGPYWSSINAFYGSVDKPPTTARQLYLVKLKNASWILKQWLQYNVYGRDIAVRPKGKIEGPKIMVEKTAADSGNRAYDGGTKGKRPDYRIEFRVPGGTRTTFGSRSDCNLLWIAAEDRLLWILQNTEIEFVKVKLLYTWMAYMCILSFPSNQHSLTF